MIYDPREDSRLLEKYVKIFARGTVLDMGTGSGIQAKAALLKTTEVLAADINPEAVAVAKAKGINAVVSDLFENVNGSFDVIVFNPPYLPEESGEPADEARMLSGGKKGNEVIERFLASAGTYLTSNGIILLLYSSLTPDIESIVMRNGFALEILEKEKHFQEDLIVTLLRKKE